MGKKIGVGKQLIRFDGQSMICDVDDFGNIIPETCEVLLNETEGQTESFKKIPTGVKR